MYMHKTTSWVGVEFYVSPPFAISEKVSQKIMSDESTSTVFC